MSNRFIHYLLSRRLPFALLQIVSGLLLFGALIFSWYSYAHAPMSSAIEVLQKKERQVKAELGDFLSKKSIAKDRLFARRDFTTPSQANRYLKAALAASPEVKLVGLLQGPMTRISSKRVFEHVFDSGLTRLQEYTFTVTLQGSFGQVMQFLKSMKQYHGIFWRRVSFVMDDYPNATIELQFAIYTPPGGVS